MPSPLENLCGPGKPLTAEPADAGEFDGLRRSGAARLADAALAGLSLEGRFEGRSATVAEPARALMAAGSMTTVRSRMTRTLTSGRGTKASYHHGDLRQAALARGREVVALSGPDSLALRALARDLGVSATALHYHFGSQAALFSAVAATVLEELEKAGFGEPLDSAGASPEVIGTAWIAWAEKNPFLYRLASGGPGPRLPVPDGLDAGSLAVSSPWRVLREAFIDHECADLFAFAIHGLALARIDGADGDSVARALRQLARARR